MTEVVPRHIEPESVLRLADLPEIVGRDAKGNSILEVCETVGGGEAFVVRNFHENFSNPQVNTRIRSLTGISSSELHAVVE